MADYTRSLSGIRNGSEGEHGYALGIAVEKSAANCWPELRYLFPHANDPVFARSTVVFSFCCFFSPPPVRF